MGDMMRNYAAHEWRQLCQAAFFELEPVKLLERIAQARSAVLDRIEDSLSKPIDGERYELRNALETLSTLRELAERDIDQLKKTVQTEHLDSRIRRSANRVHAGS